MERGARRGRDAALSVALAALGLAACASEPSAPAWTSAAPSLVDAPETPAPEAAREDAPAAAVEAEAPAAGDGEAEPAPAEARAEGAAPEEPAADERAPRDVVAWVAGTPVSAADVLSEWYWIAGRELWLVFDKLVAARLATVEAQRLGVRLSPESVELRVAEENRRLAREVAGLEGDVTVEDWLRRRGFEPDAYFRHLRTAAIRQMVAERAVRAWTLGNEWARARLIVVDSREALASIQEELAGGADFAALAAERSLDDSREAGGLVPFLVRQEHSPLARMAFVTPVGEVAGPLEVSGHHALLLVEERHAALPGAWRELAAAVEASLSEFPLTDSEFLHWKLSMEKRYSIDAAGLEELLGE